MRRLMQSSKVKTLCKTSISAADLERHFEAGLNDFKALVTTVDNAGKGDLIDLLAVASEEIAAARS